MSGKEDTSGSKNAIQQIKSTITYLKSVTFESIIGLASTDANLDDDGNSTSEDEYISQDQAISIKNQMAEVGGDMKKLLTIMKVDKTEDITVAQFPNVIKIIEAKRKSIQ